MRRLTDDIVLSLKDQIRTLRYSIRSEADVPGSGLPDSYRSLNFGPLGTVGTMIGTPVIRMADGLFTQVESVTLSLLERPDDRAGSRFPRAVGDYFGRGDSEARTAFTRTFYTETKALLRRSGARHMLVLEHAIEDARLQVIARHGDLLWPGGRKTDDAPGRLVDLRAAIGYEFARARPIQRLDLIESGETAPRHLMLSPNLYVGMVMALATAIVSVRRDTEAVDALDILDSADSVVDARFDRLKAACQGKTPIQKLAEEFGAVLPFLP